MRINTSKKEKYPEGIITKAAKNLYDEGLIKPAVNVKAAAEERQRKKALSFTKSLIKGYLNNPYPNRRARRNQARALGHLNAEDWPMRYKATNDNSAPQTFRKDQHAKITKV